MTMTIRFVTLALAFIMMVSMASTANAQKLDEPSKAPASDPSQFRPLPPLDLPPIDPAMKAAGEALLRQAADTFKNTPAIICRTEVNVESGDNKTNLIVDSMFGADGTIKVETADSLIVVKDGWLNMILYSVYDRYIRVPASSQISDNIFTIFGDRALAGFEILMREGQPLEVWLETLMMRSLGVPVVRGVEVITTPEGKTLNRVQVIGRMGAGSVDYDAEKKMIVAARSSMYEVEGFDGFQWSMEVTTTVDLLDKLPEPITFDPGRRQPVQTRRELDPVARNVIRQGQPAPPLRLPQLDGPVVDLAQLKGEPVLLTFWASHSKPGIQSLELFEQIHKDRESFGVPFKMYAVNVTEKLFDEAELVERVSEVWSRGKYEFPVLIAMGDMVKRNWGIVSIPLIVLIDEEGRVAYVQYGLMADARMKIESALKKPGSR